MEESMKEKTSYVRTFVEGTREQRMAFHVSLKASEPLGLVVAREGDTTIYQCKEIVDLDRVMRLAKQAGVSIHVAEIEDAEKKEKS